MTHLETLPLLALLACGLTPGCQALADLGLERPGVAVEGVRFDAFTLEATTLVFDVRVTNPYSVPLPLLDTSFALESGGHGFLSGHTDLEGTVPAGSSRTIQLPLRVVYQELVAAVSNIHLGQLVPWGASFEFGVDAPAVGRLALPLSHSGELALPAVPEVDLESAQWTKLGLLGIEGELVIGVKNTNEFQTGLAALGFALELGGTNVAELHATPTRQLAPGERASLRIPISIQPAKLGSGLLGLLSGNGGDYELDGTLALDTPHGPLSVPVAAAGRALFRR